NPPMKNPLKPACLISSADNASCAPGSTSGFSVLASSRMVGDFTVDSCLRILDSASEYSSPSWPPQLRRWPVRNVLDSAARTHHDAISQRTRALKKIRMKAPPFAYRKAATLAEVFDLLDTHGDGARLLAGGQSLLAALNLRLSSPQILIDITGVPGLSGIEATSDKVTLGALTTHAEIERSPEIARTLPVLAQAAPHIAHVAIRNVGTIGGSIALADPAAEWPACCLALGAEFVIAGKAGNRRVRARDFFQALYTTALGPAEVLTAIE